MADSSGLSVEQALSQPVEEMLPDEPKASSSSPSANGHASMAAAAATTTSSQSNDGELPSGGVDASTMSRDALIEELTRVREERDGFEGSYKGLLGKLTQMRSTLGDRLRQDAEELDRRETQIEGLQTQVDSLNEAVATLKTELVSSHADNERVTRDLDSLRISSAAAIEEATRSAAESAAAARTSSESESGAAAREAQVHSLTQTVEGLKVQLSTWQASFHDEQARREEAEATLERSNVDRTSMADELARTREALQREQEGSRNLQMVLEEFQAEQEAEVQRALSDYQRKYEATAMELEELKEKSKATERRWNESKDSVEKAGVLEREVREKNLLIGKLRHEAVILNEHLTEALRRLNRESTDTNVDRRLVTNVLLQFLTTPRQDAKRFEMLNLLATILQWNDEEKETAGVQRSSMASGSASHDGLPTRSRFGLRGGGGRSASAATTASSAAAGVGQEESFSNLFVEFLLSEADQAKQHQQQQSQPTSPTQQQHPRRTSGVSSSGPTSPTRVPATAPPLKTSFDSPSIGSSRRTGSISTAAGAGMSRSPTKEFKRMNLGQSIREEASNGGGKGDGQRRD